MKEALEIAHMARGLEHVSDDAWVHRGLDLHAEAVLVPNATRATVDAMIRDLDRSMGRDQ